MKYLLRFIIPLCILFSSCQYGQVKRAEEVKVIDAKTMSPDQSREWEMVVSDWNSNTLQGILDKYKMDRECTGCGDIAFEFEAPVNENGYMDSLRITERVIICAGLDSSQNIKISDEITDSFRKLKLPVSFNHHKLKMRVGNHSKC